MILGIGGFTSLFLVIFQPFGAPSIPAETRTWFLLGFGASVACGLAIMYWIVPGLFKSTFSAESWLVKREIAYLGTSFALVSILNYGYNSWIGRDLAPQFSFPEFFGITVTVGIFPVVIMVFLVELYLNRRRSDQAEIFSAQLESRPEPPAPVPVTLHIVPETTRSSPLSIPLDSFLFAVSDNNYSTVFFRHEGNLQRQLLRLSLKKLEDQLEEYPELVRCHRSYIVNTSAIRDVKGNARSLYLILEGVEESVPVSRAKAAEFLNR